MGLSSRERKILWAKTGGRCSFRYNDEICGKRLVKSIKGKDSVVGKECHIVGEGPTAARYIKDYPDLDSYDNRILLCEDHHKIIDDHPEIFTIEALKTMKKKHEEAIAQENIEPVYIKNSVFRTTLENVDEGIGMNIEKPTRLSGVESEVIARNTRKVTGVNITNLSLRVSLMKCNNCNRTIPDVSIGLIPSKVICPYCNTENKVLSS